MVQRCRGVVIALVLGAAVQTAAGQRLTPGFPVSEFQPFTSVHFLGEAVGLRYQSPDCRGRLALRIAEGGLMGAAAGWLGYELVVGIWVSGEGAKPDASMRRLRTTLILAGATFGAARAVYTRWQCDHALAGA